MSIGNLAEAFAFMMTESVVIKPFLGVTGSGVRSYGPAKIYPCRMTEDAKPIFTATGEQVVSTSTILVYPRATDGTVLASLSADAALTLSDGTSPRILRAGSILDFDGALIYWRIFT